VSNGQDVPIINILGAGIAGFLQSCTPSAT
jgi:hypothetical protein